jgi:YD repeat-containing protein
MVCVRLDSNRRGVPRQALSGLEKAKNDPLNRVTKTVCVLTNITGFADTIETRHGYDEMNRLTNNGTDVSLYDYDAAGQLTDEISAGVTISLAYDEAGNWISAGNRPRSQLTTAVTYFSMSTFVCSVEQMGR